MHKPLAKERSSIEFVLVSDSRAAETNTWIEIIRKDEKVEVDLPILVAPRTHSDFWLTYDPRGLIPYFCLIDAQGIVQARGLFGAGEWSRLQRERENPTTLSPFSSRHIRFV